LDANLAIESLKDARPLRLELSSSEAFGGTTAANVVHAWPTVDRERGHDRGSDRDVRAGVEEIGGCSIEARRPGDRNGHEAQSRPAALLGDRRREIQHLVGRREIVVGGQGHVVAEKERVRVGYFPDERLDELIIRVEAAREDDGQDVHTSLATVSTWSGTGPK
jgi:hypothetical protein